MTEPGLQDLFLQAHAAFDPAGTEINQLRTSGVSAAKVLALYPYSFTAWLPKLLALMQAAPSNHNMAARLNGVSAGLGRAGARVDGGWYSRWRAKVAVFELEDNLLDLLSGPEDALLYGELHARQDNFAAVYELLELAANWPQFPYLHAHEVEYERLLHAGLCAIAPAAFTMANPPLIEPGPWQRSQFGKAK